jgi:hypothetical protein
MKHVIVRVGNGATSRHLRPVGSSHGDDGPEFSDPRKGLLVSRRKTSRLISFIGIGRYEFNAKARS